MQVPARVRWTPAWAGRPPAPLQLSPKVRRGGAGVAEVRARKSPPCLKRVLYLHVNVLTYKTSVVTVFKVNI